MTPVELALALAIAKVCVNESAWSSPADCALIWQATESHGDTPGRRLDWLRRHSWPVFEGQATGNARWTSGLRWDDHEPDGWPSTYPAWSVYVERWRQVRKFAAALVMGWITRRPCEGRVWSWGGRMDAAQAEQRGLVPLSCEGTRNVGYALPRTVSKTETVGGES